MRILIFLTACLASNLVLPLVRGAAIQDTGFELATPGAQTSNSAWVLTTNTPDGVASAAQFSDLAFPGKGGANAVWFKPFEGETSPGGELAQAELLQIVVAVPGIYDLSFRANREENFTAAAAFVEISSDAGDIETFDLFSITPGAFGAYAINNFVASGGTTMLTVRAVMQDGSPALVNPQSLLLDDFELRGTAEIPEPGTIALLGGGLAALLYPRRRRGRQET